MNQDSGDIIEALAGEQLKHGLSVIIDAVSPVQEARDMWYNLAREQNATLIIIECVLNEELHRKRIESRIRKMYGIPEVTWEDVENRRKQYLLWKEDRLVLDTAHAHEKSVLKALDYIERRILHARHQDSSLDAQNDKWM